MSTREGASVRGGDFGDAAGHRLGAADVDAAVDAAVQAVGRAPRRERRDAAHRWGGGVTIDAAALGEFTAAITGPDGVLASAARHSC